MAKDGFQRLKSAIKYLADLATGKYADEGEESGSPPSVPDDEIHRTAVHEAGHALCAWASQGIQAIASLEVLPGKGGNTFTRKHAMYRDSPSTLWEEMSVSLGGLAAEALLYGRFRSGECRGDLLKSRAVAEGLHAVELREMRLHEPPWTSPRVTTALDVARMYETVPHPRVARMLNGAYLRSRSVVTDHRQRLLLLARELAATHRMSESEIRRVLGPRPWAYL